MNLNSLLMWLVNGKPIICFAQEKIGGNSELQSIFDG